MTLEKQQELLIKYQKNYQKEILLVSRPTVKSTWSNRCLFASKEYDSSTLYNHRMILENEIVFEYDLEDSKLNKKYVLEIAKRLSSNNIKWAMWFSGGKSYHLHCFVNVKGATDLPIFKRSFMSHFTKGLPKPDMQLCSPHLIRCEYGVNERTGKHKFLVSKTQGFPFLGRVPKDVWEEYGKRRKISMSVKSHYNTKDLVNSVEVKLLLDTIKFKEIDDGRERSLWALIHILKHQYKDKDELKSFLIDWYKYCGGKKLSASDISRKIDQQWGKEYTPGITYLRNLIEDLGGVLPKDLNNQEGIDTIKKV
jgi:hypothetical protein